jgi:Tfp pilus assembly protein PilO
MNLKSFKQFTIKQKIFYNFLLFIFLSIIIIWLIIEPTLNKITDNKNNILNQKIELEKSINREKNINKIREKIETVEPELIKFNKIFINENRKLEFIMSMEKLASDYNITQKIELSPINNNKTKNYKKIPITITTQGDIKNVLDYLTAIESYDYYININKIEISTDNTAGVLLKITANTYWQ